MVTYIMKKEEADFPQARKHPFTSNYSKHGIYNVKSLYHITQLSHYPRHHNVQLNSRSFNLRIYVVLWTVGLKTWRKEAASKIRRRREDII